MWGRAEKSSGKDVREDIKKKIKLKKKRYFRLVISVILVPEPAEGQFV